MGKGSKTVSTTNQQPPPQFQAALNTALTNTQNTAAIPFQPYTGSLQAPFSPDQERGFGMIEQTPGTSAPYINAAAQYMDASTAPLQPTLQPYSDAAMQQFQQGTQSTAGSFRPYAQSAMNNFSQASNPLTPQQYSAQAIQGFENPYTQSVVNATQQQFNNQNAQQFNQLQGNAASQGALGGDRVGVAQGVMAGQQAAAQNPIIAGLYNQGFNQAQQEFNQQQGVNLQAQQQSHQNMLAAGQGMTGLGMQALQSAQGDRARQLQAGQGITGVGGQQLGAAQANAWLNSQAGFGMANLGNQAQSSQLQAAQALLGAGAQQQAHAQQGLNIPYQQWLAQQSYPFQTANWLNSGVEGLSATAGGSGVSTTPGPSPVSQIAGLGLGALAVYGQYGGFGGSGSSGGGYSGPSGISPDTDAALARAAQSAPVSAVAGEATGGRVGHRAPGGSVPGFGPAPLAVEGAGDVPDMSGGYLPNHGDVAVHVSPAPKITTQSGGGGDSTFGTIAKTLGTIAATYYGGPAGGAAANALSNEVTFNRGGFAHRGPGGSVPQLSGNGNVTLMPSSHTGGVSVPQLGFGNGGGGFSSAPPDSGALNKYLSDVQATAHQTPPPAAPVAAPESKGFNQDELLKQLTDLGFRPNPDAPTQQQRYDQAELAYLGGGGGGMKRGGEIRGFADGGSPDDGDLPLPPPDPGFGAAPAAAAPSSLDAVKRLGDLGSKIKDVPNSANPWTALATAGFGMAAGTSPHALTNIGRGALEGIQQYTSEDRAAKALASKVDEARAHLALGQAQGEQQGAYHEQSLAQNKELTTARLAQEQELKRLELAQTLAMNNSRLGQEAALARARLAEEHEFHQANLMPADVREAQWLSNASDSDKDAYRKAQMIKKGMPDLFGDSVSPTTMPPITPAPTDGGATPDGSAAAAPSKIFPDRPNINEALFNKLPPAAQAPVKAYIEGRMAIPGKPTPYQQAIVSAAQQIDPTLDATDYNKRLKTVQSFSGQGQNAQAINAAGLAMQHADELNNLIPKLPNTSQFKWNNEIRNWASGHYGDNSALVSWKQTSQALASELRKAFAGASGGTLEEVNAWKSTLDAADTKETQISAIRNGMDLLRPRLVQLAESRAEGMGTQRGPLDLVQPSARKAYERVMGEGPQGTVSPTPRYHDQPQPAGQRPFQAPAGPSLQRFTDPAEAGKLPPGTHFLDGNGIERVRP